MSTEMLFTKRGGIGIGCKVEVDHGRMRPDDYPKLYAAFARHAGCKPDFIEMHTLHPDQHRWGVWWAEYMCPDGVRLTLIVDQHTGHETYLAVKRELKSQRDVVAFKTLRVNKLLPPFEYPTPSYNANNQPIING